MAYNTYNPSNFGQKEVDLRNKFYLQMNDARNYFLNMVKPRLDRSYKLYTGYTGDRQKEIQRWQANIFVPYVQSVVETLMPRVLDARPEFGVQGRNYDDQMKVEKQQQLLDYLWEIAKMDNTAEDVIRSSLIFGTGFLQVYWKKDVRTFKFLDQKDINSKKYTYKEKDKVYYDAPYCEWVDNYNLWYDWHNTQRQTKQFWFKRLVLTEPEIRRRYPMADRERLDLALQDVGGDLNDYASVRNLTKSNHQYIIKGIAPITSYRGIGDDKYNIYGDQKLRMYEVFEWIRPFDDAYAVMVGASYVPILKGAVIPFPYDFKESPFVEIPYLKLPYEFEGWGIPLLLENPQIMLNLIKNQRLDEATLSIHKMWIVNPLSNINREELVTRPFGIIYTPDPNGVREVQFSDIKASAYREEELLKGDMRYASGVDDFSMGVGGGSSSATEVRHLRESTLERVRLFINHVGEGFSDVLRYWMDMERQFMTKAMTIRIVGDNGQVSFPLIEPDDLKGYFDYKATVIPSIAGQNDVKRKQDMDLFQLLVSMPFVDPRKLTTKVLYDWNWNLESISTSDEEAQMTPEAATEGMPPEMMTGMQPAMGVEGAGMEGLPSETVATKSIPPDVLRDAMLMVNGPQAQNQGSPFGEASRPINLTTGGKNPPPTPKGVPAAGGGPGYSAGKTTNPRGFNRNGKVNTNIATKQTTSEEDRIHNRVNNIQR